MVYIIGITGSIASGKSYLLKCFARHKGVYTISSDKMVHELYEKNKNIFYKIQKIFPESIINEKIDRGKLGALVFKNPILKKELENIVYPELANQREALIKLLNRQNRKFLVLEIPLLFENNLDEICDLTISVISAKFIKFSRAKKRSNISKDKLNAILKTQLPDFKKLQLSDITINSGNQFSGMARVAKILLDDISTQNNFL